jgi:nucleoid-associated protein YgaU
MAFSKNSRYFGQPTQTADGRQAEAVTLRILPDVPGDPYTVKEDDRLDLVADRLYRDPTRFWRIADANTELDARRLNTPGRIIKVPKTK